MVNPAGDQIEYALLPDGATRFLPILEDDNQSLRRIGAKRRDDTFSSSIPFDWIGEGLRFGLQLECMMTEGRHSQNRRGYMREQEESGGIVWVCEWKWNIRMMQNYRGVRYDGVRWPKVQQAVRCNDKSEPKKCIGSRDGSRNIGVMQSTMTSAV